ncbi:SEC63 [Lepeophtheirus salmonis]|uniref:SEC63 n=1 Tax=Lepeophtheirus salmonis TaxID=72036 RepID=A0A7R8H1E1_LEPSM|nr:SEC63 [Lepeophtheirus salmonis]CAF2807778.1 SEC63 [Lepeophtheirus salmonis]
MCHRRKGAPGLGAGSNSLSLVERTEWVKRISSTTKRGTLITTCSSRSWASSSSPAPTTPLLKGKKEESGKKSKVTGGVSAKGTLYWDACREKAERLSTKDPWRSYKKASKYILLAFDYEMANFDPYEILEVSYDSTPKEIIKKKYRELSLKYHPDKPTGNEKLFMKLTKAHDALTDETAKYNWEHYGNPDGPQAMQFGMGLLPGLTTHGCLLLVVHSIKFSGEQVLLDTTQLYYYFFHKTPQMMLKRIIMVLAASLEFERGHNQAVVERPTDNVEIPQLMKHISNLGVNNKEKPLCFGYSVKARTLLFCAFISHPSPSKHSSLGSTPHSLAGRIARRPSLDTIESTMKLSPMIVQALWDKKESSSTIATH